MTNSGDQVLGDEQRVCTTCGVALTGAWVSNRGKLFCGIDCDKWEEARAKGEPQNRDLPPDRCGGDGTYASAVQGEPQKYGHLVADKHCCTVCDAKKFCHVCEQQTLYACSDCRIDFGVSIYVCAKSSCRAKHEAMCSSVLRASLKPEAPEGAKVTWRVESDWVLDGNTDTVNYLPVAFEQVARQLYDRELDPWDRQQRLIEITTSERIVAVREAGK